jgi:hypothetical protein
LSSVAALEANINESFADNNDGITIITDFDIHDLQSSWDEIEKLGILEKYKRFCADMLCW